MYNFYFFKYTLEEFILRPIMFKRNRRALENMYDKKGFRNHQQYQSQQRTEEKNYFNAFS